MIDGSTFCIRIVAHLMTNPCYFSRRLSEKKSTILHKILRLSQRRAPFG